MSKREIKWSQWSDSMERCGRSDYETIMGWMKELGMDAKKCVKTSAAPHALYGRVMHDDEGRITEIRFYCEMYLDDEELDGLSKAHPNDTLYVAHR